MRPCPKSQDGMALTGGTCPLPLSVSARSGVSCARLFCLREFSDFWKPRGHVCSQKCQGINTPPKQPSTMTDRRRDIQPSSLAPGQHWLVVSPEDSGSSSPRRQPRVGSALCCLLSLVALPDSRIGAPSSTQIKHLMANPHGRLSFWGIETKAGNMAQEFCFPPLSPLSASMASPTIRQTPLLIGKSNALRPRGFPVSPFCPGFPPNR